MTVLTIKLAPNPIFKTKCERVEQVTPEIQKIAADMLETLAVEGAFGLGANMVGITKAIAVVHIPTTKGLNEGQILNENEKAPYVFINPEIISSSSETQTFEEGSLSFPYISAPITRPKSITVKYLDLNGEHQTLEAEGFFATVIQHEIDYLNGKVFLDYLSPLKRDMLIKKMQKFIRLNPQGSGCGSEGHVHSEACGG
jgi:peptide deformylase